MRVAPLPSDIPVVPSQRNQPRVVTPPPLPPGISSTRSTSHTGHASNAGFDVDFASQCLAISSMTCLLGLISSLWQVAERNLPFVLTSIISSGVCLLVSALALRYSSRIPPGRMEIFFVCQVLIMNVTILLVPLSHEDPVDRAVYLTWHSAVFKLLPLACQRMSCSILQLAGSCAIDAALHLFMRLQPERSLEYDLQSIVFLCSITVYVAIFCFFNARRRKRFHRVEEGLQDLLEKVLTEAFTSWVLLDEGLHFRRSLADTKPKRIRSSVENVLDLLTSCIKDDSVAATELREAFQMAERSASRTARAHTKLKHSGASQEMDVEVLVLRSLEQRSTAISKDASKNRCWDVKVDLPCYVVGVLTQPSQSVQATPSRASHASGAREINSLAPSEEGGSADASVVSAAARENRRFLGHDNHSSSVFDIQPVPAEEVASAKSFAELVDLGRREHWIVEPQQLCLLQNNVLGSGTFGTVLEGTFYGASVAVKMPNSDKKEHLPLLNELRALRRLRHPNIVLFLAAHVVPTSNDMALVFELIEGPTLHDWIRAQPHPIECDAGKINVLRDISLALRYLHQQDKTLVHGDLKGSNVFVESTGLLPRAKLGDFGLARFLYKTEHVMGGSLRWMAPEIATGQDRSPSCKADVFSLGGLMSFALTDIKPFDGVDRNQILSMMRKRKLPQLAWPSKDVEPLTRIKRLGDLCYSLEPSTRPDIMKVLDVLDGCRGELELQTSPSVLT